MGKYGTAAVRARQIYQESSQRPDAAWRVAAAEIFPDSPESRRKGCPRHAFVGLCAAGMVQGIPPAASRDSDENLNAAYAVTAARLLTAEPQLGDAGPTALWRRVMAELGLDTSKKPNGQMDVVLALWKQGLLATTD